MAAEPNVVGVARLLYLMGGADVASWGLWGTGQGWAQRSWLGLGGAQLFLRVIGNPPLNAWLAKKHQKAN
jgi:hypothetical protein